MREDATDRISERVDAVYRDDSRRVFATLIQLLGDFDAAGEALHDALRAPAEFERLAHPLLRQEAYLHRRTLHRIFGKAHRMKSNNIKHPETSMQDQLSVPMIFV